MCRRDCLVLDWPDFWRWTPPRPDPRQCRGSWRGVGESQVCWRLTMTAQKPIPGNWFGRCGLPLPRAEHCGRHICFQVPAGTRISTRARDAGQTTGGHQGGICIPSSRHLLASTAPGSSEHLQLLPSCYCLHLPLSSPTSWLPGS